MRRWKKMDWYTKEQIKFHTTWIGMVMTILVSLLWSFWKFGADAIVGWTCLATLLIAALLLHEWHNLRKLRQKETIAFGRATARAIVIIEYSPKGGHLGEVKYLLNQVHNAHIHDAATRVVQLTEAQQWLRDERERNKKGMTQMPVNFNFPEDEAN